MQIKQTRIDETFNNIFKQPPIHRPDTLRTTGRPIFEPSDIYTAVNDLDRVLRHMLIEKQITIEYFSERFRSYALVTLGMFPTEINTQKNNLLKAIRKGGITDKKFVQVLCGVLGYRIADRVYKLVNENGGHEEYSCSKVNTPRGEQQ